MIYEMILRALSSMYNHINNMISAAKSKLLYRSKFQEFSTLSADTNWYKILESLRWNLSCVLFFIQSSRGFLLVLFRQKHCHCCSFHCCHRSQWASADSRRYQIAIQVILSEASSHCWLQLRDTKEIKQWTKSCSVLIGDNRAATGQKLDTK